MQRRFQRRPRQEPEHAAVGDPHTHAEVLDVRAVDAHRVDMVEQGAGVGDLDARRVGPLVDVDAQDVAAELL